MPACAASPIRPVSGSSADAPATAGTSPSSAGRGDHPGTLRHRDLRRRSRRSSRRPRPSCTPVSRDPDERHHQRRRVTHEIEQVIEPAARIGRRPTVQFGLHPRYPLTGPTGSAPAWRRHSAAHLSALQPPPASNRCRPSPCDRLSRPRSTTATPPHPRPSVDGGPVPPGGWLRRRLGRPRTVPVFTAVHSIEEEPDSAPAASPCLRRRPSARPPRVGLHQPRGVPHPSRGGDAPLPAQIRQVRAGIALRGFTASVPHVLLSIHARRTHAIWQC